MEKLSLESKMDLDGTFLETYRECEGNSNEVEELLKKWENWKRPLPLIPKEFPFTETEVNYLGSSILEGFYAWYKSNETIHLFRFLCQNGYLKSAEWLYQYCPDLLPQGSNHLCREYHPIENATQFSYLFSELTFSLTSPQIENWVHTFFCTCRKGQLKVAQWLYEVHSLSHDRQYCVIALGLAYQNGHLEVAKWLKNLAQPYRLDLISILRYICRFGHLEVLRWFISIYGVKRDDDAIRVASAYGHLEIIKELSQYYDFLPNSVFYNACGYGHLDIAKWVLSNHPYFDKDYAFKFACYKGRLEIVRWLHDTIPDIKIDSDGFILTCVEGHLEIAKLLYQWYQINPRDQKDSAYIGVVRHEDSQMRKWLESICPQLKRDYFWKLLLRRVTFGLVDYF